MAGLRASVVVPAYNSASYLRQCLASLASQQGIGKEQYEVIVVDDGSTDDTASVASPPVDSNSIDSNGGVRYYYQENSGPASARNKGALEARGDIVLFTDADCIPDPGWVSNMLEPFSRPEVSGVKGVYRTEQCTLWARFAQVEFDERYKLLLKSKYIDMVDTYSGGYRRDVFVSMGGFDTSFPVANNEDTDLSYRMSLAGHKLVFNPGAVVRHLKHPDSFARYMRLKFSRGYWRMVVYQRYSGKMFKDSYTPQTLKLQALGAFAAPAFVLLYLFSPEVSIYGFVFSMLFFVASSAGFTAFAFKRDRAVGVLSLVFLFLRALALGSGALYRLAESAFGGGKTTGKAQRKGKAI